MNGKDLLAAIGGHLHLFLGMSLLSFIEIVELDFLIRFEVMEVNVGNKKKIYFKEAEKLKMDGLPNAARSPHYCLSFIWLVLLVCSTSACAYLIWDTINQYNTHQVVTNLVYANDQSKSIHLCNYNPMTSDYALDLLRNLSLLFSYDYKERVSIIQSYMINTCGNY